MTVKNAQLLLRQQVCYAKLHIGQYAQCEVPVKKRSAVQASILSLHLGLLIYLGAIFGKPSLGSIGELALRALPSASGDYRHSELRSLLCDELSWLSTLQRLVDSMSVLSLTTEMTPSERVSNAIASTWVEPVHWSTLEPDDVNGLIGKATEMLERHCQYDEEH